MLQIIAIGLGAGTASALLFASIASGAMASVILFYLSPLPIMIAALGWSHWAGLIAAVTASFGLAAFLGPFFLVAFLVGIGLPAWWLGYLALLARSSAGDPQVMEWYPPGRLVVWAAVIGAATVIAAIPNFGLDEETFRAGLRTAFERTLNMQTENLQAELGNVETDQVLDMLAALIPIAAASVATMTSIFNLWLAGRIVNLSGHLRRPWPNIPDMRFAPTVPVALGIAIAGSFLPNLIGSIASILAASLLMAYAVLGFAVLHALTRNSSARGLILTGSYLAVLLLFWPLFLMVLTGLADTAFNIRDRVAGQNRALDRDT